MRQEKINSSTFEGLYLLEIQKLLTLDNLNTQKIEPHRKSEDISEIKVPSLTPSVQNSHSNSPSLEHFLFFPNNRLVPLQKSYRE